MYLPDVNVWLALAFARHPQYPKAKNWFEKLPTAGCSFCRITQLGFLRLATNPKAFGDEAVSLVEAWPKYDALLNDPRVAFIEEPAGLELHLRGYTRRRTYSPNLWSDAYLAAFARAASLELVTFDKAFAQFKKLKHKILS
jgi:toxin-antitoxin system PIN domain toxin